MNPTPPLKVRTQPLAASAYPDRGQPLQLVSTLPPREQLLGLYEMFFDSLPRADILGYAQAEMRDLLFMIYESVTATALRHAYARIADSSPDFMAELAVLTAFIPTFCWGSDIGGGRRVWAQMALDGSETWDDGDFVYALVQLSMRRMQPSTDMLTALALKLEQEPLRVWLELLVHNIFAREIDEHLRDN